MKKKSMLLLVFLCSFFALVGNVFAATEIPVNSVEDYFNAIETIHGDSNKEYVINLNTDIVMTNSNKSLIKLSNTIDNGNIVTIIGNGHKYKCEVDSNCRLKVSGGATLYLGKEDGSDTLYIEGGGTSFATQESLVHVSSGNAYMYDGVALQNNHSGVSAAAGSAVSLGDGGIFTMEGGVMQNNSSTGAGVGGAVDASGANCKFIMNNGEIKNNESSFWGGAIYQADGTVELNGGKISSNTTPYLGAGVAITTGTLKVGKVIFENNSSTEDTSWSIGGAILIHDDTDTDAPTVAIIDGATFIGNNAYEGGAIINYGTANVVVKNCTFDSNIARHNGGAINNYGGSLTTENNVFIKNNAIGNGGAIFSQDAIESKNDVIKGNSGSKGAGVYVAGGSAKFGTTRVFNNKAISEGNDFYISSSATNLAVMDASLMNGYAIYGDKTVNTTTWYDDSSSSRYTYGSGTPVTTIASGTEYKLTVSGEDAHVIKMNTNGGSYIDDVVVLSGNSATKPSDPTKYGKKLTNWYTNTGLTDVYDWSTVLTSNINLYAKWEDLIYEVIDGANQDFEVLSEDDISFTINADYSLFTGGVVYINGVQLDESNYSSKSGSTIITLKQEYLNTLIEDTTYNLRVLFNDGGVATTTFNIVAQGTDGSGDGSGSSTPDTTPETNNPNTGDNSFIYSIIFILSAYGLLGLKIFKEKKNY